MSRSRRPKKLRFQALVALLALVCFAGGVMGETVHLMVEEHEVCAHGSLVHSGDHEGEAADDTRPQSLTPDIAAAAQSNDAEGPDTVWVIRAAAKAGHHDHCDDVLAPLTRASSYTHSELDPQLTLRAALSEGFAAPQCAPQCAVYLTAPKASPPV